MAGRPRWLVRAQVVGAVGTAAFAIGGAYLLQDVRLLLLLVPPSLTYFLLDAVRDAKHQKALQAALDAKREAEAAKKLAEETAAAAVPLPALKKAQ